MQVGARRAFGTLMKTVIAVGQMTSTGDRARNLQVAGSLMQQAKERYEFVLKYGVVFVFLDRGPPPPLSLSHDVHTNEHTYRNSGAAMLFLPECFSFIGTKWQETVAAGEPLDGPCISHMQQLAREHKLWLSLGGFNEKPAGEEEKVFNCHLIIDDQGATRAVYRKIHLFDVVRCPWVGEGGGLEQILFSFHARSNAN